MVITPYDKSSLKAIERAIQNSDLGVNPNNDGVVIRLDLSPADRGAPEGHGQGRPRQGGGGPGGGPQPAAGRPARTSRRFEKDGEISSDELDRAEKELERVTHEFVADIDRVLHHKEEELLAV